MRVPHLFVAAAVAALAATDAPAQSGFIPSASKELIAEIVQKDAELFAAVFTTCDGDRLATLVADDFEFYHDKSGQPFNSGPQWVTAFREMCDRQKLGTDYRARRELDTASSRVYPLQNYGAIHMGLHRFYRKLDTGGEQLVEVALFTNLWKREPDGWKLTRVLSYDHRDARSLEPGKPIRKPE